MRVLDLHLWGLELVHNVMLQKLSPNCDFRWKAGLTLRHQVYTKGDVAVCCELVKGNLVSRSAVA